MIKLRLSVALMLCSLIKSLSSAPKTWPYMKTYDIWETNKTDDSLKDRPKLVDYSHSFVDNNLSSTNLKAVNRRRAKGES